MITISFILFVGIISSAAMMVLKNPMDYISMISGAAQLLYLVVLIVALKVKKENIQSRLNIAVIPLKEYLFPILVAFSFAAFSSILQETLPIPQWLSGNEMEDFGKSMIAYIIAIFVIAPLVEEMVFRGMIMTKIRRAMSGGWTIFFSALLFGFIHLMTGSVITAIHAFLGGLIFSLVYEKTGSLAASIVAHVFGNLGGMVPAALVKCAVTVRYGIAIGFAIVSIFSCAVLVKKASRLEGKIAGDRP